MNRDIEPRELEALEWALELDRRAAMSMVRDDIREAMEWGDLDSAGFILGAQSRVTDECSGFARSETGLVSIPTSVRMPKRLQKRSVSAEEIERACQSLDAFLINKEARRLAMLRRGVGFSARCNNVSAKGRADDECLMITLTYAGTNEDWSPRHVAAFMKKVRAWMEARGESCRYVWVAELQKRGVIHYHVALWVPVGMRLPFPDQPYAGRDGREYPPMWPHGITRIEVARAAVPYLLKYLSKDTSKTFGRFPRGARIYGVGGLDHAHRRARRWLGLPSFVQANSSIYDEWKRAPKGMGGWISPDGEHFPSEFQRVQVAGHDGLQRVCTHARSIEVVGAFAWLTDRPKVREVWMAGRVGESFRGAGSEARADGRAKRCSRSERA